MDKIFISNEIKLEILKLCGLPVSKPYNLSGQTILGYLKNDNNGEVCRALEEKLQQIAFAYNTGKTIVAGDVTVNCSVNYCIKLVLS
jgi:hypothetical protein